MYGACQTESTLAGLGSYVRTCAARPCQGGTRIHVVNIIWRCASAMHARLTHPTPTHPNAPIMPVVTRRYKLHAPHQLLFARFLVHLYSD
jgi:hypothetical protein